MTVATEPYGADHRAALGRVLTMDTTRKLMIGLAGVLALGAMAVMTTGAGAQGSTPAMTVTPQSGVRPLPVTITGTNCASTQATPSGTYQIRIAWQVDDEPWTEQTRLIADGSSGAAWTTAIELSGANLGTNSIDATCLDAAGAEVTSYPQQQVEVLPEPPELTANPTSVSPGASITATADQCPDPDGPILGGSYFVRFTLEYQVPPSGTEGPYSESVSVWSNAAGLAQTVFTLPAGAPTEGGAYRLSATCRLEELGGNLEIFPYTPVAIQVTAAPTPTPTGTPQPSPTPSPTATPGPTPQPTSTPQPTATPQPTPTPKPGGGVIIYFTG